MPVVAGLILTAAATTASADSKRVPYPAGDFTWPAYVPPVGDANTVGGCAFPVFVHIVKNNEYQTLTTLADGTVVQKYEGSLVLTLTNTNTGKAITVNSGGPGINTYRTDGVDSVDAEGLNTSFWNPYNQRAFGLPGVELSSGHLQYTFNANVNEVTSYSLTGHSVDACALLS
jgi:hypothetical protein